ncbi:MAG TPA: peptide ABC transporter substrate-binding protein, partial [Ruminococcaceae bacterium]|nr:peptide ABC transporter substrate-binding protein [Oscillospiraceae bacterium]
MKSKKLKRFLALALSAALLLSACSSPSGTESSAGSAPAENAKYRETLHIAVTQQAPSLDLHKNSSLIARQICDGTVWEKLVTLNSKAEAVPELAEKYEATNDGKTLTFTLRKGVLFHDGSEMTADDVVASMNRWIEGFSSAGEMVGDARFVKVDDHTVKIDGASSLILLPAMIAGAAQPA